MKTKFKQTLLKIEEKLLKDDIILEYLPREKFLNILKSHHQNMIDFFEGKEVDFGFYEQLDIPYTFFNVDFNLLKEYFVKDAEKEVPKEFIEKFVKFKSLVAQIFIKKEILSLEKILKTPYDNNLLFTHHTKFIKDIVESIKNNDLDSYPYVKKGECCFKDILNFPKSKMIIQTQENLEKIQNLHHLIHKSSNIFYLSYKKGKYNQAYAILQILKEHLFRFIKILSELYFLTFQDIEEKFLTTALQILSQEDVRIAIIDIKNLKNFNIIYGERLINEALKIMHERVEKFMKNDYEKTITIKANTSDFFILNVKYDAEEYRKFLNDVYEELNKPIEIDDGVIINIPVIIGGMKLSKDYTIDKNSLLQSLIALKNMAKKESVDIKIIETKDEFDKLMDERIKSSFIIKKLNEKAIDLMFQPIFETKTKEVFSLEVLGRIKDGERLLPAGIFIDKIYELQLIEKFDSLILEKLIEKEKEIKQITNRIFLNVSFQSLLNNEYMKKLKDFLEHFEIEVILELTEQKFVSDLSLIKSIYDKYKIRFAVDDFGTGYSSLQLVVELVELGILKILKIDGSLVKNIESNNNMRKIIELIAKLGNDFKLITVAEFVENQKILELLKNVVIDLAQGYFLSKPKTIEELLKEKGTLATAVSEDRIYDMVYGKND
ncbi:MAG: EAL domain-containing protein [Epsilonproteobacteria bacterium]|nr:EAL domain-containing protein [Campylobacterota bacterium]